MSTWSGAENEQTALYKRNDELNLCCVLPFSRLLRVKIVEHKFRLPGGLYKVFTVSFIVLFNFIQVQICKLIQAQSFNPT